ncbi:PIN domain-like protein [Trichophaea hybrida]|nr:PIN domain-like protein [Trichophaea hybrida]
MGITGLLPLLRSIQRQTHIREWAGKTVGVDAYGWLHKGTISCAIDLALGKPTTKYVDYVMNRVKMLRHFGVTPYLVFDGDYLPSKAGTEAERERKRAQSKASGLELLKLGRTSQAHLELQKSIDVNPTMARHIIDACAAIGVKCLVAPYEADSQLYYLEKIGIFDAVVSEDSDLLVFGVKCLITKLDQFGECIEINRENFAACREVSLAGWTQTEFRHMCILSGCDYLENIPSMGLKTAHRLMRRYKDVKKVLRALQFEGKKTIPDGYLQAFHRADMTFQHQRVFCPLSEQMVMANDPDPGSVIDDEVLVYIGPEVEAEIVRSVARGDLDPITKEPILVVEKSSVPNPFTRTWAAPGQSAKFNTPPPKNKSITSFFKPRSELRPTVVRTPLQSKDLNQIAAFGSFSAPAKTSSISISMKRPLSVVSTTESKKLKITPSQERTYSSSIPHTAERSSFFQTQSRRSISTPTAKLSHVQDLTNNDPQPIEPDSTKKDSEAPAHDRFLPSQMKASVAAPKDSTTIVTKNWKELYGFPQGQKKLTEIIENQRRGSVPRKMTPLQHLEANKFRNSQRTTLCRSSRSPRPEPSTVTNSTNSSRSQDDPSTTGTCTGWSNSSKKVKAFGRGMFDKFTFDKL